MTDLTLEDCPVAYALRYKNPDKDSGLRAWIGIWNDPTIAKGVQDKIQSATVVVALVEAGVVE